jgi:hypothetical protein
MSVNSNLQASQQNMKNFLFDNFFHLLPMSLKVHKIENFFGSEFEFYTIAMLVMLKY